MTKLFTKFALAAGALVALPGMAQAGTSTATGAASMNVLNQCSITGATVNLGTYAANQTWGNIGAALGKFDLDQYFLYQGSKGKEYLNYGSVTCDNGTPYTFSIKGTLPDGAIGITINGKTARLLPMVFKLGGNLAQDNYWVDTGYQMNLAGQPLSGTGTGNAQSIVGHVIVENDANKVANVPADSDALGVAGTYTDTLSYTLNF